MKITLQRDDIYRLNNIVHRITKRPNCKSLHYIEFRGKPALALHQHDWSLVMPISGRKPKTPFKVKYRPFRLMDLDADEKIVVDIDTKKRLGKIKWTIAGRRAAFSPFAFTDLD